jgi:hypothetical protein
MVSTELRSLLVLALTGRAASYAVGSALGSRAAAHAVAQRQAAPMMGNPASLGLDLTGKVAFVAGVADATGYGWAICKALAEAGATVTVGTWPPVLGIFERSLRTGKFDDEMILSDGSKMEIAGIYALDAVFDTPADVPEDVKARAPRTPRRDTRRRVYTRAAQPTAIHVTRTTRVARRRVRAAVACVLARRAGPRRSSLLPHTHAAPRLPSLPEVVRRGCVGSGVLLLSVRARLTGDLRRLCARRRSQSNKRYAGLDGFTISEVSEKLKADYGKIDIMVHSLANGPEVTQPHRTQPHPTQPHLTQPHLTSPHRNLT